MKIIQESNGTITLDGQGTLLLSKNDYAIKIEGEPKVNIKNFYIQGKLVPGYTLWIRLKTAFKAFAMAWSYFD